MQVKFQPAMRFTAKNGMNQIVGELYAPDCKSDSDGPLPYAGIISADNNRVIGVHREWSSNQMSRFILRTFDLKECPEIFGSGPSMQVQYDPKEVLVYTGD